VTTVKAGWHGQGMPQLGDGWSMAAPPDARFKIGNMQGITLLGGGCSWFIMED
jgi:hypothetical protein